MVGAGWVSPSDFWKMHPDELWWLYQSKMPTLKKPDQLTESEYDALYELMKSAQDGS